MNNPINGATAIQVAPAGSLEYIELQKHRSLECVALDQHRKIFSCALALVLARSLPLPTAPVESPSAYFVSNVEQQVRDMSAAFNEKIIIDYDVVVDLVLKLWNIRYFSVYCFSSIGSFYPYSFFEIISGVGNYVDEKAYQYVNEFKVPIIDLSNAISYLFSDKKQ